MGNVFGRRWVGWWWWVVVVVERGWCDREVDERGAECGRLYRVRGGKDIELGVCSSEVRQPVHGSHEVEADPAGDA